MIDTVTRWLPGAFFIFVAGFYTIRILVLRARRGRSPVFSGHPFSAHFLTHAAFRVFRVLILAVCVARAVRPEVDVWLGPIAPLWRPEVMLAGDGLMLLGFVWAVAVHFFMAAEWRSGVPEEGGTRLLTGGPFRQTRNPMMLGVMVAQLGLFFAIPSLFTLVCLVVGIAAVQVQVRVEERALAARHGAAYDAYRTRTPRWIA